MKEFLEFFDERYSNGAFLLGVGGVILFVIGFLGCCGAQKESQCMLYTFAALLSLIVIAEVRDIQSGAATCSECFITCFL